MVNKTKKQCAIELLEDYNRFEDKPITIASMLKKMKPYTVDHLTGYGVYGKYLYYSVSDVGFDTVSA